MNTKTDEANKLWDEFLEKWPVDRIKSMTLSEYTNVGNKDTFTYWIESRLESMGSIWGGSSFKFGVYERNNTEAKEGGRGRSYDSKFAWYTKYGDSAEQAFEKVKNLIVQVVEAASIGDLETIDGIDLGDAYRWKIAFHYQDRSNPNILNIFIKDPMVYCLNETSTSDKPFSYLYSKALAKKPLEQSIFEYANDIWNNCKAALRIWKISHGTVDFTEADIEKHLKDRIITIHKDTKKGQGSAFRSDLRQNDFFYLCNGNNNLLLVGKVISDVIDNSSFEDGWIARKYEILKTSSKKGSYSGEKKGWTPSYNSTLKLVPSTELEQFESSILKPYFNCTLLELAALQPKEIPPGTVSENIETYTATQPTQSPVKKVAENLIMYGPPGTGKTYNLTKYFKDYTTSNSGESEESYLARLVADKPWWQIVGAAVLEMDRIKVRDLLKHRLVLAKLSQSDIKNPGARLWATLQSHTVQECEQVNYQKRLYPQVFWKDASSVWSVKTEQLPEVAPEIIDLHKESENVPTTETVKRYEFVTFHQSYGYEEFVEGIRPITDTEDDDESGIKFRIEPGVFKRVCQRAEKDPSNNYAIFIDEINRGNISKIFGELITLVELDKRIGAKNKLRVKLPYSKPEFGVPANLSVIGTMNTADRSIAFIDIALRRRFQFKEMMPDLDLIEKIVGTIGGVDVKALLGTINRRIEFLYDRDHMIGHSYFLECRSLVDLRDTLLKNIIPLLQEYFYGDWEKICLLLGCGNNGNGGSSKNPYPVIKAEKLVEKDILGFDHQDYDDCYRYEVKPEFIESTGEMLERFLVSLYKYHSKNADNQDE